ncbi:hypothetical protein EVAR_70441_1 [Eumeta japonica]|uniref:Uncharacterized protein n=1 Tax=Eumeta variegata TaxID=151549 RepID=A0A4C1TLM5_EUMVA|nr:hypothetical protein EVAR_70441_1 [Eumeta japonica]
MGYYHLMAESSTACAHWSNQIARDSPASCYSLPSLFTKSLTWIVGNPRANLSEFVAEANKWEIRKELKKNWLSVKSVDGRFYFFGRCIEREIDPSQAECLGRSYISIACSALSLAHSPQAERDNESRFFVRAAGLHRFIRRYHVNNKTWIQRPRRLCKRGLNSICASESAPSAGRPPERGADGGLRPSRFMHSRVCDLIIILKHSDEPSNRAPMYGVTLPVYARRAPRFVRVVVRSGRFCCRNTVAAAV